MISAFTYQCVVTNNMVESRRVEWTLGPETELRCEVNESETLILKLLDGNAEIFGIEMAQNKEYSFIDENFAVFSWYGCTLEAHGCTNRYLT